MNDESAQLPWDELQQTEAGIPWDAIRKIADATPTDDDVIHRLFDTYEQARKTLDTQVSAADLYVAAIFALAAPQFDDAQKREISGYLIERLAEVCEEDDITPDALVAAVGAMGPVVLPLVLDVLSSERDIKDDWFWLWELTALAAETEDDDVRRRTVRVCVDLLERAERGGMDPDDAVMVGWALARLKRVEHAGLIERVRENAESITRNEYGHILNTLRDPAGSMPEEIWKMPVEEWLESRWKMAMRPAAEEEPREDIQDDDDLYEDEEEEPDLDFLRARTTAERFASSALAQSLPPEMRDQAEYIVRQLVYNSMTRLDMDFTEWDEPALRELLVDVLPANLPANRRLLTMIAPVTETFLYYLGGQGLLADTDALIRAVRTWGEQIVANGLDPEHWSSVKRDAVIAIAAGADVFDPDVQKAIMEHQTTELLDALVELSAHRTPEPSATEPDPTPPQPAEQRPEEPPIPIKEYAPKISRNAPCPCGSGRKYKKCCGRPSAHVESGA